MSYTLYIFSLIIELAIEWYPNALKQQARILVAGGVRMDSNMATGYHLWRIASDR
jgi:hypothetical protein